MMFALSLLSMTLVVTQFVVSASLNTVRECTSKRTECGPWGTGVAPRFLATASTGRVGSKMIEGVLRNRSLYKRGYVATGHSHVWPEAIGIDKSLAFRLVPPKPNSLSAKTTAVLHIIRNPIDVVLGFRESALQDDKTTFVVNDLRWIHQHLQQTFVEMRQSHTKENFKKRFASLQEQGVDALIYHDLFNISGHVRAWAQPPSKGKLPVPVPVLTIKYETLSNPEVAATLQDFLCLKEPFTMPNKNINFAGENQKKNLINTTQETRLDRMTVEQQQQFRSTYALATEEFDSMPDVCLRVP